MKIEILDQPEPQLADFLLQKIVEFNWQHWEVSERLPLAAQLKDQQGNVIAGASARTFGDWLLIDTLWVSEQLRGQNIGSQILAQIETAAIARGCNKCLLDTLNFQARGFYQKHGYQVQWTQQGYPKTGAKHFMVKQL
ncbi:MAG: GNAT family N-acetyltransferase [Gammaproteobacteria bacterium]|nr:GNAT family N-acetyltransferase [Gammaproteobacteria bacterium]